MTDQKNVRNPSGVPDDRLQQSLTRRRWKKRMNKRTEMEREMDLVDIARLYLEGHTFLHISEWISNNRHYTLTAAQIGVDVKLIRERWQERYISDYNVVKAQELARIDRLEQACWEEWERSKGESVKQEVLKTTDTWSGDGEPNRGSRAYSRERVRRIAQERTGDMNYMKGIQWCIEKRISIFGLDAPKTVNVNWRQEAEKAGVNPEEVISGLQREFLEAAMARRGGQGSLGEGPESPQSQSDSDQVRQLPG